MAAQRRRGAAGTYLVKLEKKGGGAVASRSCGEATRCRQSNSAEGVDRCAGSVANSSGGGSSEHVPLGAATAVLLLLLPFGFFSSSPSSWPSPPLLWLGFGGCGRAGG